MLCVLMLGGVWSQADAGGTSRFFHSGNGQIRIFSEKNGQAFAGIYRQGQDAYDPVALLAICRVFDAPCTAQRMHLSLRLIEFLDYLEDRFKPDALITITSGYRSPTYNTKLGDSGALAAKASLHQYGMAADLKMEGVPAKRIWEFVKDLGFGGAGYYQGETVHIDVGPARFWDEKTSGVGTGISDDNKLIGIVANYDVYRPGDEITLRFIRMTAFPIGVAAAFSLDRRTGEGQPRTVAIFRPLFKIPSRGPCLQFADIDQMDAIRWKLPAKLPQGDHVIRTRFCDNSWPDMPGEITTPVFKVEAP